MDDILQTSFSALLIYKNILKMQDAAQGMLEMYVCMPVFCIYLCHIKSIA